MNNLLVFFKYFLICVCAFPAQHTHFSSFILKTQQKKAHQTNKNL